MFCYSRDWQLLRSLATGIRIIAPHQLAFWWGVPIGNARRSLRQLEQRGLVSELTVLARRLPPISQPMLRWNPGGSMPDFGKLSYVAKKRFRQLAPKPVKAFVPTPITLAQFTNRRSVKIKRTQATHELGVTEAYLFMQRRWPRLVQRCWRGEDQYSASRQHGEKVEDAQLVHPRTGKLMLAIEYAGTYPEHRFADLHTALQAQPYWIL